jgi:invasion protein IalB
MRHLIHSHPVSFAITTVLAVIAFSDSSLGQTAPAQPIWGVNCAGTVAGLDCRAIQSLQMTNTGQASVAVRVPPDTKKPVMLILVPSGIYLPAGVTVNFGQDGAKRASVQSCDSSGCLAEYAISDAEIGAMVKGQVLTVSVQDVNQLLITVQVPSNGFAAAYAKIK